MPLDKAPEISEGKKSEDEIKRELADELLGHARSIITAVESRYQNTDASNIPSVIKEKIESTDGFLSTKDGLGFWEFTLGEKTTLGLDLTPFSKSGNSETRRIGLPDGTVYEVHERRSGPSDLQIDASLNTVSLATENGKSWPLFMGAPEKIGETIQLTNRDERLKEIGIYSLGTLVNLNDGQALRVEYQYIDPSYGVRAFDDLSKHLP